jgi:hypothetical protein
MRTPSQAIAILRAIALKMGGRELDQSLGSIIYQDSIFYIEISSQDGNETLHLSESRDGQSGRKWVEIIDIDETGKTNLFSLFSLMNSRHLELLHDYAEACPIYEASSPISRLAKGSGVKESDLKEAISLLNLLIGVGIKRLTPIRAALRFAASLPESCSLEVVHD